MAGLLFGLIPVFKYAGPHLMGALRQGGRNSSEGRERHRARSVLVVVQVALALVLLIGSGLMIRTVRALKQVQPGFTEPEQILTLHVSIPDAEGAQARTGHPHLQQHGRESSRYSGRHLRRPVQLHHHGRQYSNDPIFAADKAYAEGQIPPLRRYKFISPGFFKTMGNPLLAGRDLTWTDIYEGLPVVLVSETLARELWRDPAAALGKQIRENPKAPWREVIGVVGNERDDGVEQKATTIVYWPMLVHNFWGQAVNVQRTRLSPSAAPAPVPPAF